MIANPLDPVLEFDLVLALAKRHLPSVTSVTAVDESGGEARAYVIDEQFIFKTQRPHKVRPRTSLEKEVFHLQQFAANAPEIPVPRVVGYGREGSVEYTLMTRVPGVPVLHALLEGEARSTLIRDLGRLLRRIHRVPVGPFRDSGLFPGDQDTTHDVRPRLEATLRDAVETDNGLQDVWDLDVSPAEVASKALDAVGQGGDPWVPLHSNPGPEHVFVDSASLRLTGIIDFGDAYISHPAFDLAGWTAPADRRALLAGYADEEPVDAAFRAVWRAATVARVMSRWPWRLPGHTQVLAHLRSILAES